MDEIKEFFQGLFDYQSWPPRWKCGYWSDFHGWLYIISELMVWTAYFLIPLVIINYFHQKRTTIKFRKVYVLFATFILLCGSTHFLDALMFWVPMYRLNAVIRLATGIVSLFTTYHLFQILPEIFKQRTNLELEREIARRKEAEQKLDITNQGLQAFAYAASHDLQEPLRKISTFSSLLYTLNESKWDNKSKEYAEKIMHSSSRMKILINDVLSFSTITEDIELTTVDMHAVINDAVDNLEVAISEKKATITIKKLPAVKGNSAYLTQLFYNLISNAIKFTNKPPVVTITGEEKEGSVFIKVTDNGIGLQEEDYQKIFNAFQRLHGKSEYEGTGIGLAICKRIINVHKGQIDVSSQVGVGTSFTVQLQAADPA